VRYDEVRYPSDLPDERWEPIRPVIEAWKAQHPSVSGHRGRYEMREVVNAILYHTRTGCQWRYLPKDLPPYGAVYYYFALWRKDVIDRQIHDLLRMQVREAAGRTEDPSAVVLDSQSVRAAAGVPGSTTGLDAAKTTPGRKRGLAVDVIGLIIAVVVMVASAHDNQIGTALLTRVAAEDPSVTKAFVDAGFKDDVAIHGAMLGIDVEVVCRPDGHRGFLPLPKRWVVEQTQGTLILHRRLVREHEKNPDSTRSRVYWAEAANLTRRLTFTRTLPWRWS
jgi:transposase